MHHLLPVSSCFLMKYSILSLQTLQLATEKALNICLLKKEWMKWKELINCGLSKAFTSGTVFYSAACMYSHFLCVAVGRRAIMILKFYCILVLLVCKSRFIIHRYEEVIMLLPFFINKNVLVKFPHCQL